MIIGFTGTKDGMTIEQKNEVRAMIATFEIDEYHHGDCVGSDEDFHDIIASLGFTLKLNIHPPLNDKYRAFCKGGYIFPRKDYIPRDDDIVDACDVLLAAPRGFIEELHSGTWTTIRHAMKKEKPIIIIYPDGSKKRFEKKEKLIF